MYHEHPIKILKYALKNIWLLIFPLLRGLKTYHLNIDVFYNWIKGTWFDFIIILMILGFGFIRWTNIWIRFGESEFTVLTGIFIKSETNIPYSHISVVTAEYPLLLSPFEVVRLKIKTRGTTFKNSDITLLMRRKEAKKLHHKIPVTHKGRRKTFKVRPKLFTIIFFSFLFSNSISGTIYIATLFFQLGRVSKDLLENELKNAVDQLASQVSSKFALSIPPAAAAVGIFIIATWLWSFIANILRYAGFSMKKDLNYLEVKMGTFTKRSYHILNDKINYVDLRQNLIMKIFGRYSLNISCSGYGKQKNELPVLLPILNYKQTNQALELLNFGIRLSKRKNRHSVKARRAAVMTYLGLPLCFCAGIPLLAVLLKHSFPGHTQFFILFAVMAEIPAVWMAAVKTIALLSTGITVEKNFICIRYSKFFSFHTVLVERKKLVKAQIVQNPMQRLIKRCRLDFFFTSELPQINKLHGINIKDAEGILEYIEADG